MNIIASGARALLGFALLCVSSIAPVSQSSPAPAPQQTPAPSQPTLLQRPPAARPRTVFETTTVLKAVADVVAVDVIASDNSGQPVTDLKAEDFTIFEDGKEQPIRAFNSQHASANEPGGAPVTFNLPDNVFTNVPRYQVNSAATIVLLDSLNATSNQRAQARDAMLKYLAAIPSGQPVAVYTLGSKLRLLQDFTTDPIGLKASLANLKPQAGGDQEVSVSALLSGSLTPEEVIQQMQRFRQENTVFPADVRLRSTLNALNALARLLSGYPGRKNLIWVSEAFPLTINPNTELQGEIVADQRNYALSIADTAESLLDAQIAVYPVDAAALAALGNPASSTQPSHANSSTEASTPSGAGSSGAEASGNEPGAIQSSHSAMDDLSQRTGGLAFYNRNELEKAIAATIADGSVYYTLAYVPANKDWNGRFRKIQVKAKRPGITLRHRFGYYAVNRKIFTTRNEKEQAEAFSQALDLDSPVSTTLRFDAGVIQPSQDTGNKVVVNFAVDSHAVSFEKQSDGSEHASVDCAVRAYSDQGALLKTEAGTTTANLDTEAFKKVMQQNMLLCRQPIELPPGHYILRLGVRDEATGLVGTTNARVNVPRPPTLQPKQ